MSEIITDVEFNFSSSGSSHSATISSVDGIFVCGGGLGAIGGAIGERPVSNNVNIDSLLKGFVLEEITKTKSSNGTKYVKKYVDKTSTILDSWIILCRGEVASPSEGLVVEEKIYASSELPLEAFTAYTSKSVTLNKPYNVTQRDVPNKIIRLGKTYSNINTIQEADAPKQLKKEKINHFYSDKQLVVALSSGNKDFLSTHEKATLRYGYFLDDVYAAITGIGLSLSGLPNDSANLFNFSGTVRSILSSLASFYGMYWYVQPSDGRIIFVSSAYANQIQIKDETTNTASNIISASYSTGGTTPRIVAAYVGNSSSEINQTKSSGGGGYGGINAVAIMKAFRLVPLDKVFSNAKLSKNLIACFYYFFISKSKEETETFNKIFYGSLINGETFEEIYDYKISLKNKTGLTANQLFGDNNANLNTYGSSAKFYALHDSDGEFIPNPDSKSPSFAVLKAFFNLYGKLYVSNTFSKRTADNYSFISSKVQVSEKQKTTNPISKVDELSDLYNALLLTGQKSNQTCKDLLVATGVNGNLPFCFFGLKNGTSLADDDQEDINDKIRAIGDSIDLGFSYQNQSYLVDKDGKGIGLVKQLKSGSSAAFDKSLGKKDRIISVPISRQNDQDITVEDQSETEEDDNPSYDDVFYGVRSQSWTSISQKSELKIFNGSVLDAKKMYGLFTDGGGINTVSSNSVTYDGLILPTMDISLDSVSISVGSEGITTTISRSNKGFLPPDNSIVLADKASYGQSQGKQLSAGSKNFLKYR